MPISNTTITDRYEFMELLKHNQTIIILKFGAEWCGPCTNIKNDVHQIMVGMPDDVTCLDIDVDECFDVYAYLKSKKIVNGVPCVLAYFAGNILLHPAYQYLDDYRNYPVATEVLDRVYFVGCSRTINDTMIEYVKEALDTFEYKIK